VLAVWALAVLTFLIVSVENGNGYYEPAYYGPGIRSTPLFLAAPYIAFVVTTYLLATKLSSRFVDAWPKVVVLGTWGVVALMAAAIEALLYMGYLFGSW
jgi:hypothetical protein